MEDLFRRVYRGDPGVPHTDPERYINAWMGSFAFAAVCFAHQIGNRLAAAINLNDKAVRVENNHWKKLMEKLKENKCNRGKV